jgi:hypothetical protein
MHAETYPGIQPTMAYKAGGLLTLIIAEQFVKMGWLGKKYRLFRLFQPSLSGNSNWVDCALSSDKTDSDEYYSYEENYGNFGHHV